MLEKEKAVILLKKISDVKKTIRLLCDATEKLSNLSLASRDLTNETGVEKVLSRMGQFYVGN